MTIETFAQAVHLDGGRAFFVGGTVRDRQLGITPKDIDIEVFGIEPDVLRGLIRLHLGEPSEVGASFGILHVAPNIDIGIPRRDSKIGAGHTGFDVHVDPSMPAGEAFSRRDFTMNAMSEDILTGDSFDPFGGLDDMWNGRLRVVNPATFADDPLRVLRAAQFMARFTLTVEPDTVQVMRDTSRNLHEVHPGRLLEEWRKLLLGRFPDRGFQAVLDLDIARVLHPELHALVGTEQSPEWHPEGDAAEHTRLTVRAMGQLVAGMDDDERFVLMLAAMLHDVGKPLVDDGERDHDKRGVQPAREFMQTIGVPLKQQAVVLKLVENHMWGLTSFRQPETSDAAFRRLATRLHPATIAQHALVTAADISGRVNDDDDSINDHKGPPMAWKRAPMVIQNVIRDWLVARASQLGVVHEKPKPIVSGQELIDAGMVQGPDIGKIMELAEKLAESRHPDTVRRMIIDHIEAPGGLEVLMHWWETRDQIKPMASVLHA